MRRLALVLLALTSALNWPASAQTSNVISDPEVYAVYDSTPLSSLGFLKNISQMVITEQTDAAGSATCLSRVPADWADVVEDYRRGNFVSHKLMKGFNLGLPYDLLSSPGQRALDAKEFEYWTQPLPDQPSRSLALSPYGQLPGGTLITLSAVGFDANRTRAIFSLSWTSSGPMNAQGWQLRRIKVNGVWRSPSQQAENECNWIY
jgi:hypothetical protein